MNATAKMTAKQVQAPGDVPVGCSNKSGGVFNLLRDELGKAKDMTDGDAFVH